MLKTLKIEGLRENQEKKKEDVFGVNREKSEIG